MRRFDGQKLAHHWCVLAVIGGNGHVVFLSINPVNTRFFRFHKIIAIHRIPLHYVSIISFSVTLCVTYKIWLHKMKSSSKPMLTAKAVEGMSVGSTLSDVGDYRGLRVTRTTKGRRWFYRYRVGNKLQQDTIGIDLSVHEARNIFRVLKVERQRGKLPRDLIPESALGEGFVVNEMISLYLENLRRVRQTKGAEEVRIFMGNVTRPYGHYEVADFGATEAKAVVSQQVEKGNRVQAGRIAAELSAAWDYCVALNRISEDMANPGEAAKKALKRARIKTTPTKRNRYLDDRELSVLLRWLPKPGGFSPNLRKALMLTLQVGCRSGEAISARWSDFDLEAGNWTLFQTKTDDPRTIRLPRQTLEWLRASRLLSSADTYLCQSPKSRMSHLQQKQLTERMWVLRRDRKLPPLATWKPHDLRRTCRTHLSQMGCPEPVAESAIGHVVSTNNYNLHQYQTEVGEWLQKWNDKLQSLEKM
jgi:integrase